MSPGPTFERVYLALKERLTGGGFAPGDHLEPAMIGAALNSSVTPVRDALHRLVGERIVETPRNDGFRVPVPTEAELRDLYGWNGALLDLGLRGRRSPLSFGEDWISREYPGVADLFLAIARGTGSFEHEAAIQCLNDRLGAARCCEQLLFEDLAEELGRLRDALSSGDVTGLRRGVSAYHRRRQRQVPKLLVALRRKRAPW